MTNYQEFIKSKTILQINHGIDVKKSDIHPMLFDFQKDIVQWAVKKGKAAIFLDTGLGKTFIQLEWARLLKQTTLIVAPLSVARQTVREAHKIGIDVKYVSHQSECEKGIIHITNYEMIHSFDPGFFGAVVLDESSIIKSIDGATRLKLIEMFNETPYKLACTATPAPNDQTEIGNHAEFLNVCKTNEMLSMFFVHANKVLETDAGYGRIVKTKQAGDKGQEWRLRNHAHDHFYQWMASWSISLTKPSDLGYEDDGYNLPPLNVKPLFVDVDYVPEGQLFFTGLSGIQDRHKVRVITLEERIKCAADIVNHSDEQWLIWCGLNSEGDALVKAIPGSIQVQGSDSIDDKINNIQLFQDGTIRILITKSKIAGHGMNFQNSHNMMFVGLSDSWEGYYQSIRRQWRFGQKSEVNVYLILSEIEREIYDNVMQKERTAKRMTGELIKYISRYERDEIMGQVFSKTEYTEKTVKGANFTAILGDSCQRMAELQDNSIDMSVYSPPFADLYTYSNSELDLGNSKDWNEFFKHYAFIIRDLLRITKPGRLTCVHTSDIPAMSTRDGYIGMRDFPGAVIRAYEGEGWIFVGRAIVGKNPQAQAIRTKAKALLFTQLRKDSSDSRPAILDQILMFRKDGDNAVPVTPVENGEIDNEKWIDWAGGIWTGIHESDTLQYTTARAPDDEKHICPLQLGTIERCIKLYSNPGETVFTPFMGIGSEAYVALKFGRKAIGIELKESYFNIAVKNLQGVEAVYKADLFAYASSEHAGGNRGILEL
jgi:DNA modification methylase/superfamily II DNA or RNA helicase